jgi:hypothetical protein
MNYTIKPIETRYGGVVFRSRLEAKWAAMFDLLEWKWTYEPADFNGWMPDFVIHGSQPVYVEVKPVHDFPQEVAEKIGASGCREEVMILGERGPHLSKDYSWPVLGWLAEVEGDGEAGVDLFWGEAMLGRWSGSETGQIGFCHSEGTYTDRITGVYDGGCYGGGFLSLETVEFRWREAGNIVRWEASK